MGFTLMFKGLKTYILSQCAFMCLCGSRNKHNLLACPFTASVVWFL